MTRALVAWLAGASLLVAACAEKDDDGSGGGGGDGAGDAGTGDDGDDGTGGDDGGPDDGGSGDGTGGGDGDGTGGDDGDGGTGTDSDTGGAFIQEPDGGGADIECDVWSQDCPEGEKCMPWANDGGSAWNATKCSALDPNPAQPGDECTVEGSGVSGVDNCDVASMCWAVDPETNTGYCIQFCNGSPDAPICDDPGTACAITNDGVLILCQALCDPLLQDCREGEGCVPIQDAFQCSPDASGDSGVYGDPCEYINACDPGLACLNADVVPGCAGSQGCCAPFCDASDPNAVCPGAAQGEECVAWYEEGQAPPGYEDVGVCMLPS
jgi:hypothetical protein